MSFKVGNWATSGNFEFKVLKIDYIGFGELIQILYYGTNQTDYLSSEWCKKVKNRRK